jgi:hypothetical protein
MWQCSKSCDFSKKANIQTATALLQNNEIQRIKIEIKALFKRKKNDPS